jgi:hypothetical protein
MERTTRAWTHDEEEKLFESYFSPACGLCPVCSHEVCMSVTQLGRTVTILMRCERCGNYAIVNRPTPDLKPVHRTDEDESSWG